MLPIEKKRYPWINRELIESVLKSNISATTNLMDFQLYDAVSLGENYTSHLVRISLCYIDDNDRTTKKTSYVLKTKLAKEIHDMLETVFIFAKEMAFYRDILPKFNHFIKLIDPEYKCSPRCLQIGEDPTYFIFEDLREQNYRTMGRTGRLNFKACEMLLNKLAKFHAIGCMVYEENPGLFVYHRKNMVTAESLEIMTMLTNGMRNVQEICTNWSGYEHYSEKLHKLLDVVLDRVSDIYKPDPNTFNTLTHGDLWTNNVMYKFDDANNPVDLLMVDYQIGCYGSPAIDLAHLLFNSTTNEMHEEDWDRLIQIYHTELVKSLKACNYTKSIPTLTELHIEILKRSTYSVMMSLDLVGPQNLVNTALTDIEAKQMTNEIYQQPQNVEHIKYLLDYYDRKGLLDV